MKTAPPISIHEDVKAQWLTYIDALLAQLSQWLANDPQAPVLESYSIEIEEPGLGHYKARALRATFGEQSLTIEPRGRNYPGKGIIDVTAWYNLRRVFLIQQSLASSPIVYTESRIPLHEKWSEKNFRRLVRDLLSET